jgi:hypothetical protein
MTGVQKLGVLLVVLGLVYALWYVGWLRRSSKRTSIVDLSSGTVVREPAAGQIARRVRHDASGPPPALVATWVQGTYLDTTMATSRHDRVAAAKTAERQPATMAVDDSSVRWERDGAVDVTVAGARLLGVSLERDPSGRAMGRTQIVRVSWQADNGDQQSTTFLPRGRADSAALVSAVQRLMKMCTSQGEAGHDGGSTQDVPAQPERGPQDRVDAATPQDGTP